MFIPNTVRLYGSKLTQAKHYHDVIEIREAFECFTYQMKLTKSGLKALDQPTERCDSSTRYPKTSQCIATYIEKQIGCSINIHGGQATTAMTPCTLTSELKELKNITRKLRVANAYTIYEMTGCLASCQRNEYGIIDSNFKVREFCYERKLKLDFEIEEGSFKEEEQYIIYDFDSFFADVGGIFGITLGCSIFSLYNELTSLLLRFKPRYLLK